MFEDLIKKYNLTTRLVVVENDCLKNFDAYLSSLNIKGKRCLVCDDNTDIFSNKIKYDSKIVLDSNGLHANEDGIKKIEDVIDTSSDILISLGGGTVTDLVRYSAKKLNKIFVAIPTIASVDGFASSVAALTLDGIKKTSEAKAPEAIICDLSIVANAPIRYALSGYGDMLAKYVCLLDWKVSNLVTKESIDEEIVNLEIKSLKLVEESIEKIKDKDLEAFKELMEGLLLSGIAMQIVGTSRPASGAEHHFSHLLEVSPSNSGYHCDYLHGEKVCVGTIYLIKKYKELANIPELSQSMIKSTISIDYDLISENLGPHITDKLKEENEDNCLKNLNINALINSWPTIRKLINELPSSDQIVTKCKKLGMKTSLTDFGIDESKADFILKYSPLIRNRLTLSRITFFFKV